MGWFGKVVVGAVFLVASAAGQDFRFQTLDIQDGLPQNMVDCIIQDRQGFIWFGTWNGLCRYDGYSFEVFSGNESDLGNDNFIYTLQEDAEGNIWIGTQQNLYLYIYDQDRFYNWQTLVDSAFNVDLSYVHAITQGPDGSMLVGSNQGLFLFGQQSGRLIIQRHIDLEGYISGTEINDIVFDGKWIWLGTNEGLTRIRKDLGEIKYYTADEDGNTLSSNSIESLYITTTGSLLVGTDYGLNVYQPDTDDFRYYLSEENNSNTLIHNSVMDIVEDENQKLILATLGGMSYWDPESDIFVNYVHDPNKNSISNNFLNCLYRDRDDNIWVGSERGGITYFNTFRNSITSYEKDINRPYQSLSNNTVNSVFDGGSYLWVGTAGGGLNRYNKSTNRYDHFTYGTGSGDITNDFVTSITRDLNDNLWIGTWGGGLGILENSRSDSPFFRAMSTGAGINSTYVSSIVEGPDGNIWIATLNGVLKYDVSANTFISLNNLHPALSELVEAGCLLFDYQHTLWVGSRYGLYKVSLSSDYSYINAVTKYTHDPLDDGSISGDYVISLYEDSNANIWAGTYGHGLNKISRQEDSIYFSHLTTKNGLSNNIIFGISEDHAGRIWLTTDYGLSSYDPTSGYVNNYFQYDGFLNNQYYWSSIFKNDAGQLFVGGMNGLDVFDPLEIKSKNIDSRVLITDFKLMNTSVEPRKAYFGRVVLPTNISRAKQVTLPYQGRNIGFEFAAINFKEKELLHYEYQLEGFEDEWNNVGPNRRFANYTNLSPGNYIFRVRSVGSNGEQVSETTSLRINILAPFWNTWWFRITMVLLALGLIMAYTRYRTYTLKRQKKALERMVDERTRKINQQKEELENQASKLLLTNKELEANQHLIEGQNQMLEKQNHEIGLQRDQLMELNNKLNLVSQLRLNFFTNISHEFRTPLTLITGPLQNLLKEENLTPGIRDTLALINRNANRLLHLINQIMDFRKIEQGRMELNVTNADFSSFSHSIFDAFKPLAETRKIDFTYHEEDLPQEIWYDPEVIENILYNLLSNAFKYTPQECKISLEVSGVRLEDSRLTNQSVAGEKEGRDVIRVKIIDNGCGIAAENIPLIFKRFYRIESENEFKVRGTGIGLALTDELIKSHHGEIFVESTPGKGSVFEIQFPCLKGYYAYHERKSSSPYDPATIDQQVKLLTEELFGEVEDMQEEEADIVTDNEGAPTLLVVEDNVDLRKFISLRLRKNFQILESSDGATGIEMARKHNPDVIITDLMMPKIDGIELCAYLKNNLATSHIPIIMLTAKNTEQHEIKGLESGADDYLTKPFNFDVLEARIKRLLESRKAIVHEIKSNPMTGNVEGIGVKDREFLKKAYEILENSYGDPDFNTREFVQEIGISRSLLHKKLTALTQQSATEFINEFRVKKAALLLADSAKNISEVAYTVGYNDPKYFSRVFNKIMGLSPRDYQLRGSAKMQL